MLPTIPLRIIRHPKLVRTLAALPQFQRLENQDLYRLAYRVTGLRVEDRWSAIFLLWQNPCPIPMPRPDSAIGHKVTTEPAKLFLVKK